MKIIEDFGSKKIYHHLLEVEKGSTVLFVLHDISSLKAFDPIKDYIQNKFSNLKVFSGLIETIKNRGSSKEYIFINFLNKESLRLYDYIFKLPEIFDYAYFLPNVVGIVKIPDIKMDDRFNFVLDYYKINKFILLNVSNFMDLNLCSEYIDFMKQRNIDTIMIGNNINCAEITNLTKTNPIVIYGQNKPLVADLARKCMYVVSEVKPKFENIVFNFVSFKEEMKLYQSMI